MAESGLGWSEEVDATRWGLRAARRAGFLEDQGR